MQLKRKSDNAFLNPAMIAVGVFMIFSPYTLSWLIDIWTWLVAFLGILFTIFFILKFISSWVSDKEYKIITDPENILASWEIRREDWLKVSKIDYEENAKYGKIIFGVMSAIVLGVGVIGLVNSSDMLGKVIGFIVAAPLILLFWFLWIKRRIPKFRESMVYISKSGAVINGEPSLWEDSSPSFYKLNYKEGKINYLEISYSFPMSRNRAGGDELKIPVPSGYEEPARKALAEIKAMYDID